ncbi:hypothetical protein CAC42_1630 [Sphaceloma murrayae]|uniref:Uncharacterized protein n=1 Tax=Sphaceloma murrayae TaxID=2082308 RepID=A0A2K1QHI2_9PEZI|nr:hypothetical protein CAC42_1630 [Sphaceloma murrayae]
MAGPCITTYDYEAFVARTTSETNPHRIYGPTHILTHTEAFLRHIIVARPGLTRQDILHVAEAMALKAQTMSKSFTARIADFDEVIKGVVEGMDRNEDGAGREGEKERCREGGTGEEEEEEEEETTVDVKANGMGGGGSRGDEDDGVLVEAGGLDENGAMGNGDYFDVEEMVEGDGDLIDEEEAEDEEADVDGDLTDDEL